MSAVSEVATVDNLAHVFVQSSLVFHPNSFPLTKVPEAVSELDSLAHICTYNIIC